MMRAADADGEARLDGSAWCAICGQLHVFESAYPQGMLVAGVICPGNNPSTDD